jgi:hypothetical protein
MAMLRPGGPSNGHGSHVQGSGGSEAGLLTAMHADALQGLNAVVEAAYKLVDKAVPTVLRLVDLEIR